MKNATWALFLGGTSIVLLAIVAPSLANRRADSAEAKVYSEHLRDARTLQSRRTTELLKIRSGLVSHYDGLARTESLLKQEHTALASPPTFLPSEAAAELKQRAAELESLRKQSEQLIDQFKSDQAILRNSTRYLTVLAAELSQQDDSSVEDRSTQEALQQLIRAILLLQVEYNEAALTRASAAIEALREQARARSTIGSTNLALVLKHAQVVLMESQSVARANTALDALPLQQKIDDVVQFFGETEQKSRASFDVGALVLFVLLLVTFGAAAGFVILRLQRSTEALRESGREMEAAIEKQRELADFKTRFVSMTSHEFRTPLSRVVSSSEMISAYGAVWGPEKIETHLRRIRDSALSMTKMLDSILLIGRSEAGMLKFEPAALELRKFCEDLIETVEQSTATKGRIILSLRCSDSLVGDENLLRHALENLLTNAIKYSPSDSRVSLDVEESEGEIQFAVTDHGIGIPEGDLTHLFESFHRGTNVGRISGTGLGLSIVKRAADLHRGTVWVKSKEGEGSLFSLRIPAMKEVA